MQLTNGVVRFSPSDLTRAAACEFALLRELEMRLGRTDTVDLPDDPLMARAAGLGDAHEQRVLADYRERFGAGVVEVERPSSNDPEALQRAMDLTLKAMHDGADVVFQGAVIDGDFHGYTDFLVRQEDGTYRVMDSKLARHAKVTALVQIAAYAEILARHGANIAQDGGLILGDLREEFFDLGPIIPVYQDRRRKLAALVQAHIASESTIDWEDPNVLACGRCPLCEQEAVERDDLLLVAGMRMTQRAKLRAAGISTVADLAGLTDAVPQISAKTLATLKAQASLQHSAREREGVSYDVFDPATLAKIPPASQGDIFFDFEGDPMWQEPGSTAWGLEYLFGCVDPAPNDDPAFTAFWAHDRREEKQALIDFLEYVRVRREQWPDMHIYHYAAYEKTALLRLAARHGIGEREVDDLLRENVLVDLYPIVKGALRVSQPSYSLKKLEPLYMGDDLRTGDVTTAGDSVIEYAKYCEMQAAGDADEAKRLLEQIADYNRYDCVSTLRLRDWLLKHAAEHHIEAHGLMATDQDESSNSEGQESPLRDSLAAFAEPATGATRTALQTAAALMGAAIGFHRREDKPYWWGHFDRLAHPVDEWADSRDALVAEEVEVLEDWDKPTKKRVPLRVLRITGRFNPGSSLERDKLCKLLYDAPHPDGMKDGGPGTRGFVAATITQHEAHPDGRFSLTVTEKASGGINKYAALPMAAALSEPIRTVSIREAIEEQAAATCAGLPGTATIPAPLADLLLRRPPTLVPPGPLPTVTNGDFVSAITAAASRLDGSTLAVQGPPGTGKTHVAARVIKNLVEQHKWKVGVVSQGHSVVNHLLDEVVAAGLSEDLVGKKKRPETSTWKELKDSEYAPFLADHADGCVIGGTAWDFTNTKRVQRGQLDLLVIDEAGQYSLANTIAVSVSAKRLLLLGDPQQLPQVSQGQHPEPVDESALGWLSDGLTLPAELGYFLDKTWRMHPELTERVSRLSYEGRLQSKLPETTDRSMVNGAGNAVAPGLQIIPVAHTGNDVCSAEESAMVVQQAQEALNWTWQDSSSSQPRGMSQQDILVVAPYNAQVAQIREDLATAGLGDVRVGTVDKFQGQQAAVVLVSMTASSREDVPRGMDFLLSPNRLNVAISRGQWLTQLIYSPPLTDYLPSTPDGLQQLGRFLALIATDGHDS